MVNAKTTAAADALERVMARHFNTVTGRDTDVQPGRRIDLLLYLLLVGLRAVLAAASASEKCTADTRGFFAHVAQHRTMLMVYGSGGRWREAELVQYYVFNLPWRQLSTHFETAVLKVTTQRCFENKCIFAPLAAHVRLFAQLLSR